MKKWYEELFENYGNQYDRESFVHGTMGECDFLEKELNYDKTMSILDIGCGTGRHCVELAKRGYTITGIDLSEAQLARAREKAGKEGVSIRFIQCDARDMPFKNEFDAAIMLCEGGFPLMETDEMNYRILESATKSLKPGARFIFTTLNGLFSIFNNAQQFHDANGTGDGASYDKKGFDLMTFREYSEMTFTDDDGTVHTINCTERHYVPSEITWLLKSLGYVNIDIYGARLGAFSRNDRLTENDFEMLVIANRAPE